MEAELAPSQDGHHKNLVKEILTWGVLVGFLVTMALMVAPRFVSSASQTLRIGLVGPMSGPDAKLGESMVAGANLVIERMNATAGDQQKRIELVIRDDKNDPETARQSAIELAEKSDVLAVLGHLSDRASTLAGPVYREHGLVAVTGNSGVADLTINNDWYFRVGLTSTLQGTILASYMARVMEEKSLIIIHDKDAYGLSLLDALDNELSFLKRMGIADLAIKEKWGFDSGSPDAEKKFEEFAKSLSTNYAGEIIFLAVHEDTAATLVPKIKDNPRLRFGNSIPFKMIGPESLSNPKLVESFSNRRREKFNPGYYTEGIRAVVPFLVDIANQKAQNFRRQYQVRYDKAPDVVAAGFHDAATMVVAALNRLEADPTDVKTARREIQAHMSGIDGEDKAIVGVTGNVYFDRDGNAVKSVPIGIYRDRRLISPPVQLSAVSAVDTLDASEVFQILGEYFTQTKVIHTGIQINEIRDIDLDDRRVHLDFNIWFRFHGNLDLASIEFSNAAKPIDLGAPLEKVSVGDVHYRLFRVKGIFKTDFIPGEETPSKRLLGLQVRHDVLNREKLILAPDVLGMESGAKGNLTEQIERKTLLGKNPDWTVERAAMFLDTEPITTMGNPKFSEQTVEGFSRFNFGVWLESTDLTLSGLMKFDLALQIFLVCGMAASMLTIASFRTRFASHLKWFWFPQVAALLTMLVCVESVAVDLLNDALSSPYYVEMAMLGVHVLWWMIPAWLLNIGIERFFWTPLEQKTGRDVPGVVRAFSATLLYILAFLGVTAFVFDQKITSLLATSGVLAMIIGLAIQMNISNIFSGIAINVERPFRMGDWILVGEFEPGKVVDITWRTTRIETIARNIICIPNSVASDSSVTNLSYPEETYRSELLVHVDPGAKPQWVEKILMDAVISTVGILQEPEPIVLFQGVKQWSAEYSIRFFCRDYLDSIDVNAAAWRDIVRNLRYAGFISVIYQEFTLFQLPEMKSGAHDVTPLLIDDVEVFQPFGAQEKHHVCQNLRHLILEPERMVMHQGDQGDSLFIVAGGALVVEMEMDDGNVIEVGRLGAGDFFGEAALLTGEPRGATVRTITQSQILEITKDDIAPIIREFPGIAEDLSKILTRRTLENLRKRNAHFASLSEEKSLAHNILSKIGRFFDVSASAKSEHIPIDEEPADTVAT